MDFFKLSDSELADFIERGRREAWRRAEQIVNGQKIDCIWDAECAKRALQVARAGEHSICFVGPVSTGKTLLRALGYEYGVKESYESRSCPCGNYGLVNSKCSCTSEQIEGHVKTIPIADITVSTSLFSPRYENQPGMSPDELFNIKMGPVPDKIEESARVLLRHFCMSSDTLPVHINAIKRVSATIAAMDFSRGIRAEHMTEAINYRPLSIWNLEK